MFFGKHLHTGIDRLKCRREGMPVIRIAFMGIGMNDKTLFGRGDESGLVAKLIPLAGLAFGNAGGLGFMETVEFIFGGTFLFKEPMALIEKVAGIQIKRRANSF